MVYVVGGQWDERRNSSRVFGVPPHALADAQRSLAALRRDQPALVAWVEEGAPLLTHADHVRRFGESYRHTRARRPQAAA